MGKTTEQHRHSSGHEGSAATAESASSSPPVTEYESIEGLNLNLLMPDADCSNRPARGEAAEETEYEGALGDHEAGLMADDGPLPDALLGSYALSDVRAGQEVIIGPDNRIRINATASYPWRAICALKITAANGRRFIGTGWLVSPRTVITAGHCVFMHNEGGWARSIEVIPGLNDAARPFNAASSGTFHSVTGWTQSRNRDNDYGAIILPANARLGDRTGWFGFATRDNAFLQAAALNLSGYPGDKGGNQQWFMAQRTKSVSSRVITYDIDTMGGQSGSPVWVLQNGSRYAVGIHTNGASSGNSATRIESNVFARITDWKNLGL